MKFTTPCFIRKNTPELRKKLEEIGYVLHDLIDIELNDSYLYATKDGVYFTLDFEISNRHNLIDCGENEQLFLALAALRDDSDKFQWFCDDNGLWEMSESDLPSRYMQINGHKASVNELIAHFKEK